MNFLFDLPQPKLNKKIRLCTFFSGIGSQEMAMRDIGADFEIYKCVEFDKYAIASYNAIHGTNFPTIDICNFHGTDLNVIEKDKYNYVLTYSYPCTDLSVAGKMEGMKEGSGTRSALLWEVRRILQECKELADKDSKYGLPDILLMENVSMVHSEQNMPEFQKWLDFLESLGYFNHWQDLNAKDFGIPQNRNRCFCVSILSKEFIDFDFPKPIPLTTVMRDYLEEKVDEKYYINTGKAKELVQKLLRDNQEKQIPVQINYNNVGEIGCKIAKALDTRCKEFNTGFQLKNGVIETVDLSLKNPSKIKIANCIGAREDRSISTLSKVGNGVLEKKIQKVGQISNEGSQCGTVVSENGIAPTLSAGCHGYANPHICTNEKIQYRIRKLTPKECWRLMGYTDEDFEKAAKVNSNSQLYKQAGNAIVKQVLMAIFLQMGIKGTKKWNDMTVEERQNLVNSSLDFI